MKTKHLFYGGAVLAAALIAGSALSINAHADSNDDNGISVNTHGSGSNKQVNVNVKGLDGCNSAAVLTNQGNIDNIKNQLDINDSDVNDIANMSLSDAKSTAKDKLSDVADNALTYYQAHGVNGIDEHDVSQVLQTIRKRANNNIDHAMSAKQVSQIYEDALEGAEASAQPTTLKVSADTNNNDNSNSNNSSNSSSSSSSSQSSSSSSSEALPSSSSSSSHRDSSSNREDKGTDNNSSRGNTDNGNSQGSTATSNANNQSSDNGQQSQQSNQILHFSNVSQFLQWVKNHPDSQGWPDEVLITTRVRDVFDVSDVDADNDIWTDFLGDDNVDFSSTRVHDVDEGDIVTVHATMYEPPVDQTDQLNGTVYFSSLDHGSDAGVGTNPEGSNSNSSTNGSGSTGATSTDPSSDGTDGTGDSSSQDSPSTLPQTGAAIMNNKAVVLSGSILAVLAAVSGGVVLKKDDKK